MALYYELLIFLLKNFNSNKLKYTVNLSLSLSLSLSAVYGGYGQVRSEGQNVAARQQAINAAYEQLVQLAEERKKHLEDAIKLFDFYRECEEVEGWVKEKEVVLKGDDKGSAKEQLESMQKKYDVGFKNIYILILYILSNVPYYTVCYFRV